MSKYGCFYYKVRYQLGKLHGNFASVKVRVLEDTITIDFQCSKSYLPIQRYQIFATKSYIPLSLEYFSLDKTFAIVFTNLHLHMTWKLYVMFECKVVSTATKN